MIFSFDSLIFEMMFTASEARIQLLLDSELTNLIHSREGIPSHLPEVPIRITEIR